MTDQPWLSEDQQRVWRLYLYANRRLMGHLAAHYQKEFGLSAPDYEVLVNLSEAPGGRMRAFELGEQTEWEKSRLSHHLKRMSQRGLVARDGDHRYADVVLTETGRAAIQAAAPAHSRLVRHLVFDGVDPERLRVFGEVLAEISERTNAHQLGDGYEPDPCEN
ncbi:DNA-binding MarR family transcriptional regulator [Crossiella equi]|uniref:DNA-binding MarR family transcriptional regulator n=1 Tax=Crossiella equi TaxID=130796 RepID=A0ABS5ARX0_9PSEU|nr:MarR family winged helix-turn-helix transcriptional regulator [Crossiella equi]MBP2479314.1 DNA-binding MarR family transcriptional regulator [Crossiella equi]